jgi:hypothetical protein
MHIIVLCRKVCVLHCSTTFGVFSGILPQRLLHRPSLPPPAANTPVFVPSPSTVNSPPKVVHKSQFLSFWFYFQSTDVFFFLVYFSFVLCCTMKKMLQAKKRNKKEKRKRKISLWPIVGSSFLCHSQHPNFIHIRDGERGGLAGVMAPPPIS